MADSKLRDLSTDFAVKVIKLCDSVKGHYSLVNQLERSSTSIGANIHEANYAHSKADFIAKFQIALKECYEAEFWLELFVKSELLDREIAKDLYHQRGTIRRMLIALIKTAKESPIIDINRWTPSFLEILIDIVRHIAARNHTRFTVSSQRAASFSVAK